MASRAPSKDLLLALQSSILRTPRCPHLHHKPRIRLPTSSASQSQSFHSTPSTQQKRRKKYKSLTKAQLDQIQKQKEAAFQDYTEEESAALEEKYNPQQLQAINNAEAAITPADMVEQGALRRDILMPPYLDTFDRIEPKIDKKVEKLRGEGQDYEQETFEGELPSEFEMMSGMTKDVIRNEYMSGKLAEETERDDGTWGKWVRVDDGSGKTKWEFEWLEEELDMLADRELMRMPDAKAIMTPELEDFLNTREIKQVGFRLGANPDQLELLERTFERIDDLPPETEEDRLFKQYLMLKDPHVDQDLLDVAVKRFNKSMENLIIPDTPEGDAFDLEVDRIQREEGMEGMIKLQPEVFKPLEYLEKYMGDGEDDDIDEDDNVDEDEDDEASTRSFGMEPEVDDDDDDAAINVLEELEKMPAFPRNEEKILEDFNRFRALPVWSGLRGHIARTRAPNRSGFGTSADDRLQDKYHGEGNFPDVAPEIPRINDPTVEFTEQTEEQQEAEDEKKGSGLEDEALDSYMRVAKQLGTTVEALQKVHTKILHTHRVVNQTRLGKIQSLYFICVAGNKNGMVGIGEGKGFESDEGDRMARLNAIRNMVPVLRYERRTIFGSVSGKVGASKVELSARRPGFG